VSRSHVARRCAGVYRDHVNDVSVVLSLIDHLSLICGPSTEITAFCNTWQNITFGVISGFRRDVDDICALLGYYAASSGSSVPTFRDNISVPPSRVKKYKQSKTERRGVKAAGALG
jgi:hypothetical protein